MYIVEIKYHDPVVATIVLTINMALVLVILGIIYLLVRPKSRRVTTVYLSGEGEEIVKSISPSPLNLYWNFVKRFARTIYSYLTNAMHTGNMMDWISYMVSWYGLLILLSLVVLIVFYLTR